MCRNGTTPENILQQYRNASQAQAADTNRDGQIDANEFAQSLYSQADANNGEKLDFVVVDVVFVIIADVGFAACRRLILNVVRHNSGTDFVALSLNS